MHSGENAFGAAGPMQIGIGGAAGNVWGGASVHPASEVVDGVTTDPSGAIFACNGIARTSQQQWGQAGTLTTVKAPALTEFGLCVSVPFSPKFPQRSAG